MNVGTFIDKLLKKSWTPDQINKYLGPHLEAYLGYALDEDIRDLAASGGATSAILLHLLETKSVEGVLVCSSVIRGGKVRARYQIATSREEVLAARGSKYVTANFAKEALPLLNELDGQLAVVGLPCNIAFLRKYSKKNPTVGRKIVLAIALFCGHNSTPLLINAITCRLEREAASDLVDYKFRIGHWRGQLHARFRNGETIEKPSWHFNLYQNLYFFADKKCLWCNDHFGYAADLSIGDVWSYPLRNYPVKPSGIVVKTDKGKDMIDKIRMTGECELKKIPITEILDGQSRVAPFHYNISARSKAGKLFNLRIPDRLGESVRWHEWIVAFLVILNWKWSQSKLLRSVIFKTPKPLLKLYLYMIKGLESL